MIVNDTMELGPIVNVPAIQFSLPDHNNHVQSLTQLLGGRGVILGFIGDIWQPVSVRRIMWLQRHLHRLALLGTPLALLVRDHPNILYGFHSSSPLPVPFPLLADANGAVHQTYGMDQHPGLLLIDNDMVLRHKWLMPDDRVWPKINELIEAIEKL